MPASQPKAHACLKAMPCVPSWACVVGRARRRRAPLAQGDGARRGQSAGTCIAWPWGCALEQESMMESTREMEFRGVWNRGARGCALVMVKVGDHREGWRRAARQWWLSYRGWTLTPWKCWGLEPASVLAGDILVVLFDREEVQTQPARPQWLSPGLRGPVLSHHARSWPVK
jgi:hypothetical protein